MCGGRVLFEFLITLRAFQVISRRAQHCLRQGGGGGGGAERGREEGGEKESEGKRERAGRDAQRGKYVSKIILCLRDLVAACA
jgi:hypothetical protein